MNWDHNGYLTNSAEVSTQPEQRTVQTMTAFRRAAIPDRVASWLAIVPIAQRWS